VYHEATNKTQLTLTEVNDLSQYDADLLCEYMPGISDRVYDELDSTQHFLRVFSKLRNENIHGQQTSRIIGSIVISLCCLVLWDSISSEDVQSRRSQIKEQIETAEMYHAKSNITPTAFFPIDRIANSLENGVMLPSDLNHPQDI
jgi:hypothetical protein